MQELISVIVPIYNVEKYLDRCVKSIQNQTYQNLEIILVDDGSPDNSPIICEAMAKNDSRIVVLHKENGGLSDARNAGLEVSTGKYVCFFDSDDWVEPNCLEIAYNSIIEKGSDFAVWSYIADFVNDNEYVIASDNHVLPNFVFHKGEKSERLGCEDVIRHLGYAWNKLYRKSFIGGHRFEKGLSLVEDMVFNEPLFCAADTISFIDNIGTHYIQRGRETLGNKHYSNYVALRKRAIKARCNVLKYFGVSTKTINNYRNKSLASTYYSKVKVKEKKLKNLFSDKTKNAILNALPNKKQSWSYPLDNNDKVFIFLGGFYQNLGDMAITYAQKKYLENIFPSRTVIVVPSQQTYSAVPTIKKHISSNDIITVVGGGNMDNNYQSLEDCRLHVVSSFPKNKIILFPQTISFDDKKSLQKSREVYSSHTNLTIFARENDSYERAKKYFPDCNVKISPDIVMSLGLNTNNYARNNVLLCLRSDKEQSIEDSVKEKIIKSVGKTFDNIITRDTVDVSLEECKEKNYINTINNYLNIVSSSKLVITDRLHCMIFCAITSTPCVVFNNSNNKVKSFYETWLKDYSYIHLVTGINADEIINICKDIILIDDSNNNDLSKHFIMLKKSLLGE